MTQRRFDIVTKVLGGKQSAQDLKTIGSEGKRSFDQIRQSSSGASGGLRAVNTVVRDLGSSLRGTAGQLGTAGVALSQLGTAGLAAAAGIAAATAGLSAAVQAANEFEKSTFTIVQLLDTTGGASGKTAEEIERLARAIGEETLASTNDVRKAAAQLLTFRSIAGEAFDRTLVAAQDLAALGMGSITSATQQLAKALEDPATGLTMLRRVGVSFSEAQTDMIKGLVESGRLFEAQSEILSTLEAQVGGAGSAQAGGLAGATDTLAERWGILLENVGNAGPIQTATQALSALSDAVGRVNSSLFVDEDADLRARRGDLLQQESQILDVIGSADPNNPAVAGAQKRLERIREEIALLGQVLKVTDEITVVEEERSKKAAEAAAQQAEADRVAGQEAEERRKVEERRRRDAEKLAEQEARAAEKLARDAADRLEDLELETEQLEALYEARLDGIDAYEAELEAQGRSNEIRERWIGLSQEEQDQIREKLELRDQERQRLEELIEAEDRRNKAAEEAAKEAERAAEEAAKAAQEPFLNAAEGVQRAFADTFTDIFANGVDSFSDLADQIKNIFFRLAGELVAVNLFGDVFANIGLGGNLFSGGSSSIFSDFGLSDVGSLLNGGPNLSGVGSFVDDLLGTATTVDVSGITGIANDVVTTGGTFANIGSNFTAGAGLAGFGGSLASNLIFGGGGASDIGSTAGGVIGTAVAGPVGAFVGSFLGGALGGLFGNDTPPNEEANNIVDFSTFGITASGEPGEISPENAQASQAIATTLAQIGITLEQVSGAQLPGSVRVGAGSRDGIFAEFGFGATNTEFGWANDTRRVFERSDAGIAELIQDTAMRMAEMLGDELPPAVRTALDNIDFNSEGALADLNFAGRFDDIFGLDVEVIGPVQQSFDLLQQSIQAASDTAARLGLSLDEVAVQGERANQQFTESLRDSDNRQILALLDPQQAELLVTREAFDAARADRLKAGQGVTSLNVLQQLTEERILAEQISDAEAERAASLELQLVAIGDQIAATENLAATARGLISSVDQIQTGRLLGAGSPLSPSEQFALAQSNLDSIASRIQAGELVDASELSAAVSAFDQINLEIFGLSEAGVSGFDQVSAILDQTRALASTELSRAESQLSELQKQTSTLEAIRDQLASGANDNGVGGVTSVPDGFSLGTDVATNAALLAGIPRLASIIPQGFGGGAFVDNFGQLTPAEQAIANGIITGGFATGGSFQVGGSGLPGTDRERVAVFNASARERVTIETQPQQTEARMLAASLKRQSEALDGIRALPQVVTGGQAEMISVLNKVANTLGQIQDVLEQQAG